MECKERKRPKRIIKWPKKLFFRGKKAGNPERARRAAPPSCRIGNQSQPARTVSQTGTRMWPETYLVLPTTPIVILTVRPRRNKEVELMDNDFTLNSPFCPVPLQKIYPNKKHYRLGLALFVGNGVQQINQETQTSLWINFGCMAGHIAALIIVSILIQYQLQTNNAKARTKIRTSFFITMHKFEKRFPLDVIL